METEILLLADTLSELHNSLKRCLVEFGEDAKWMSFSDSTIIIFSDDSKNIIHIKHSLEGQE